MLFDRLHFGSMPSRVDQLLIGAVLDVDAVGGKPGDVVGDLIGVVGVAVFNVHAEVAVEPSQRGGQGEVGFLGGAAAVGPADAGCDAEAGRADRGEAALQ